MRRSGCDLGGPGSASSSLRFGGSGEEALSGGWLSGNLRAQRRWPHGGVGKISSASLESSGQTTFLAPFWTWNT
jgi:hypothetical protein